MRLVFTVKTYRKIDLGKLYNEGDCEWRGGGSTAENESYREKNASRWLWQWRRDLL